jgi:curved DNA-binding protein CbpA
MEATIDPLKILDLPKNYNTEMLREAYKRMALKAHPDKGGSEYLFKLVTQCYKYLAAELKKREADKQFHELKQEFMTSLEKSNNSPSRQSRKSASQPSSSSKTSKSQSSSKDDRDTEALQALFYKGSRFDQSKFNKFFTDNKMKDELHEAGYKEWMEKNEVSEAPQFNGSFNQQGFNSHFERHAKVQRDHKQLIRYQEPEALVASKNLGFTELGQASIDDFSGDNKSLRNLNYTDYRLAHTTSRIVDPSVVKRQDFRSIQELETAREKVSYQMSDMELVAQAKKERMLEENEQQRQMHLRNSDQRAEQHYQRLNGLLSLPSRR